MTRNDKHDARRGVALRDEAITRIEGKARRTALAQWGAALDHIRVVCAMRTFSTDDVWARLSDSGLLDNIDARVMGALMRHAANANWCRPRNAWVLSTRPECHRRPVRQWAGLLG